MQSPKKYRTEHKKKRPSVSTSHSKHHKNMSETHLKQKGQHIHLQKPKPNPTQQIHLFHLEEQSATHQAKCQLQQISEGRVDGGNGKMGRISGWGLGEEDGDALRGKTEMGVYRSKDRAKLGDSNVICEAFKRAKSKTQTAYRSNYLSKQNQQMVSDDLKKLINLGQENAKNNNRRYLYNQVVTLVPEIVQVSSPNILKIKGTRPAPLMPTALIQAPFGVSLKNRKIKGSNLGHTQFQKNIHLRKMSNNHAINRKYKTQAKEESPKKNPEIISDRDGTSSIINFNTMLRKTFLNSSQTKKARQHQSTKPTAQTSLSSTSPIHFQLQKLKKLLSGEHLNYMQIGSSCPIKIHGLKSSSNIEDK